MRRIDVPFNISILDLTPEKLVGLKQIKVLDSMDGATLDFHPEGLFSTKIFGKVGDSRRELIFAYIDIKVTIFHPLIYRALVSMKRFHGDIMAGKKYAKWNEEKKSFDPATPADGQTGMSFFVSHWRDIEFENTGSDQREQNIALINRYKDSALTSKIVVMPAGLRDMEIDDTGRRQEDEINAIYRKFIMLANSISESSVTNSPEILNKPRFDLQRNFNLLYDTLENMVKGKKKMFQGQVASRRIQNGTRNVITAGNPSVSKLGSAGVPNYNSTIMGLYQFSQAIAPVTLYKVRQLLQNIFTSVNEPAYLVDKKTLTSKPVQLSSRIYDQWGTNEGLRKIISSFREEALRDVPIEIAGRYLALLYVGPDMTFRFFNDIEELPADRSAKDVRPVTLTDLLYIALYKDASTYPVFVTRYPVTGIGSIYPSFVHLRVTAGYERRKRLGPDWSDMGEEYTAHEFPVQGSGFVNSLIPHSSHLGKLGADFDGDTSSANVVYSLEAMVEVTDFMKKRKAYVGTDGKFLYPIGTDTVNIVLRNMTGEPRVLKMLDYRLPESAVFTVDGKKYHANKVLEQLQLDKTRPILLNKLGAQVSEQNYSDAVDWSVPVIIHERAKEKDGALWDLLDGFKRVAKAQADGRLWVRAYVVTDEMLAKALIK